LLFSARAGEGSAMSEGRAWWQHPAVLAALVLAAAIPLLVPAVPPLIDLPGHMARYHIELNLASSPDLQRFYDFHWALIGNLGVDLLIVPMAKLFGVTLGTKLIVIAIPMMLTAGFLGVARELHGRIPPTALFALPLAYHQAFQFGFINFSLSAALCFLAFWLWLRLGRTGKGRMRTLIFLPLACLIWLAHVYGWGMLGLLAFAAQVGGRRQRGETWPRAVAQGALDCAPLGLPIVLMLAWRGEANVSNDMGDWFNWRDKLVWMISVLRERWQLWDMVSASLLYLLIAVIIVFGLIGRFIAIELRAGLAVILLSLAYFIIPRVLIGSGYADMRLAAFITAMALLSIKYRETWSPTLATLLTTAALVFVTARLAVTTIAYAQLDRSWREQLAAIDHIAAGSRVLVLADTRCGEWSDDRMDHVSSLAVVRRNVFTNGQWSIPGGQSLNVKYRAGAPFVTDPSHLLRHPPCHDKNRSIELALKTLPGRFDYLWLVNVSRSQWPQAPELVPVWQGKRGLLLRRATRSEQTTTGI
jgi:hypothetical protein